MSILPKQKSFYLLRGLMFLAITFGIVEVGQCQELSRDPARHRPSPPKPSPVQMKAHAACVAAGWPNSSGGGPKNPNTFYCSSDLIPGTYCTYQSPAFTCTTTSCGTPAKANQSNEVCP